MHDEFSGLAQVQGQVVSIDRTSYRQLWGKDWAVCFRSTVVSRCGLDNWSEISIRDPGLTNECNFEAKRFLLDKMKSRQPTTDRRLILSPKHWTMTYCLQNVLPWQKNQKIKSPVIRFSVNKSAPHWLQYRLLEEKTFLLSADKAALLKDFNTVTNSSNCRFISHLQHPGLLKEAKQSRAARPL